MQRLVSAKDAVASGLYESFVCNGRLHARNPEVGKPAPDAGLYHSVFARKGFQFGGDVPCLFSCNEFGGLNTIHQVFSVVRHRQNLPLRFSISITYQKEREKPVLQIFEVDICGRAWYNTLAKPTL